MVERNNKVEKSAEELEKEKEKRRQKRNLRHAHAKGLMQGILSMLRPGDVVLDCGANVGDVTFPLAETGAFVHAFEPDPYAFGKISERCADLPNVTLHNAAVGTASGSVRLMRAANFDDNPKGGSVKSTVIAGGRNIDEADGSGIDVTLVDLPDFIRTVVKDHGRIAFLKMDIEGAELDLLEAMLEQDLFENIGLTVAETHEKKFHELRPRFRALRHAIAGRFPITKVNLDWI
ncbi:MAG: FkbM family methyltransferase [Rhodobacteraceae bacterium]|nr:FkbM family methyltransferase [Paracoccaceae bacterium]